MKIASKVAALAALLVGLVLPVAAAGAEETYPTPATPEVQSSNDSPPVAEGDDGEVLGEEDVQGGATDGGGAGGGVLGEGDVRGAEAEAPSGALPLTGADVVGIAALGAAAIGVGAALVKRSRSARQSAA
jgi:5'-nucleotidase